MNVGRRKRSTDCDTCVDLGCRLHVHHAMRNAGVNRHDTATTPLRHTVHSAGLAGPGSGSTLTTGSAARAGNKPHAHRDVRRRGGGGDEKERRQHAVEWDTLVSLNWILAVTVTRAANSPFPLRASVTKTCSSRYNDLRLETGVLAATT